MVNDLIKNVLASMREYGLYAAAEVLEYKIEHNEWGVNEMVDMYVKILSDLDNEEIVAV